MQAARLATLNDVRPITFRAMPAEDRLLVAVEAERDAPFAIRRVFTVRADRADLTGGRHAHRQCHQLLVCVHGACDVACLLDGPADSRVWTLDRPDCGLLVPPGIWAEQRYRVAGTVIMVLCDRPYEADDYIRDFDAYRAFRRGGTMLA